MAFALPVWLAVQEELLHQPGGDDPGAQTCFNEFDDESLFQLFHLTRPCLEFIVDSVRIRMKKVIFKKPAFPVDTMVMMALNFYAQGVASPVVLLKVGLSHYPAVVLNTVSGVIAGMSDQFISFPQARETTQNVAFNIQKFCGIPKVLGVLAAAHFKIRASPYEKDAYRAFLNTLGYTSVVSQVICDCHGNILSVEKCCVGSTSEQEMWESSFKGKEMEKGLHGNYQVIGGKGYNLSKHVLTPVSEPTNDKERRFNEAHSKIHNVMQSTIGSMKNRFRCLTQLGFTQEGSLDKKSNIIKACSVLHNIAKKFSVPAPLITGKTEPLHPVKQRLAEVEIDTEALEARQELIDLHFSTVSNNDSLKKDIEEEGGEEGVDKVPALEANVTDEQ
ncbi:uncharacterized protein V6R79_003325 [Siganus canaliculatus]